MTAAGQVRSEIVSRLKAAGLDAAEAYEDERFRERSGSVVAVGAKQAELAQRVLPQMTEEELAELEEIIRAHKIDEWNDFCKLDLCMCSGNSWTIHVTYRESRDEYIHAMGHSEAPDGFAEGKRAIEAFFERYL